jgi:hypothetical protein
MKGIKTERKNWEAGFAGNPDRSTFLFLQPFPLVRIGKGL